MSSDKVITITEEMTVWIVLRVSEDLPAPIRCANVRAEISADVYKEPKGS